jgi:hypothetical protein
MHRAADSPHLHHSVTPVCLARSAGDLMVMLHRPDSTPSTPVRDTAVLLVPGFGWEETSSHRPLRDWSMALCAAGHTSARLQIPSTGDSAGDPTDPDRLEAWTGAVVDTAAWLRQTSGAGRVVGLGTGLGGLLVVKALAEGASVDDLILWGVPNRGRAFVRQQTSLHAMVTGVFTADIRPEERGEALTGYRLSPETASALNGLTLSKLELPPGQDRRALVLDRDGAGNDDALIAHLRQAGFTVEVGAGHGYAELVANPQDAVMSQATMAHAGQWLQVSPADRRAAPGRPAGAPPVGLRGEQPEGLRCEHRGVELVETPLWIPGTRGLNFAVLTEPVGRESAPAAVVLLGAGALWHAGPNRSWVDLARRWAAQGIPTLRVDLAGLGEADGEDPRLRQDASFYEPWRDEETEAILDFMAERGVATRFILGGLCSGAFQSLHRGLVDDRVCGVLLLNLYAVRFSLGLVAQRALRAEIRDHLPRPEGGSPSLLDIARLALMARPLDTWRAVRLSAERSQRRDTFSALDTLRDREVETLLLLGESEPFLTQLRRAGVLDQLERWPNLTFERVPSRDHMFRALWLQRAVHDALDRGVQRALARISPPAVASTA